ncbi:hypothetical protein TNCV_1104941 [Trichonephila clavipes]|nr:hypothetical protein TNCV_1104941 [Trichonephila clavipes]
MPLQHEVTTNSRRAASPFVILAEGEESLTDISAQKGTPFKPHNCGGQKGVRRHEKTGANGTSPWSPVNLSGTGRCLSFPEAPLADENWPCAMPPLPRIVRKGSLNLIYISTTV